jgi:hydrogenase maturation protease
VIRRVIGLGNRLRGDDAAGLLAADHLLEAAPPGVEVVGFEGESLALLDRWAGAEHVVLVDAVVSEAPPGTLYRLDIGGGDAPPRSWTLSTHAFPLVELIALAETLGRLPRTLIVHGVVGTRFEVGADPSPAVLEAIPALVERVLRDL